MSSADVFTGAVDIRKKMVYDSSDLKSRRFIVMRFWFAGCFGFIRFFGG